MSNDNEYVRKQFPVQAERVTPLNINRLAKWCGGKIHDDGEKEGNFSRDYIHVKVQDARKPEHERAKVGDWIVKSGRIWKVYSDKAFRKTFERENGTAIGYTEIDPADIPVIKKKGPVPTAPRTRAAAVPEVIANGDGSIRVGDQVFVPAPPVPLATTKPTDMGENVEIPNSDGSITVVPTQEHTSVVPTPDPEVVAAKNAQQVAPIVDPVISEKDITVDQELVLEGNAAAILAGEGVIVGNDPVAAQAVDVHGNPVAMPATTLAESSDKIADLTLGGGASEAELQAAIDESIEIMDAGQSPVMTEVAPGVEVSDGAIHGSFQGEIVEEPVGVDLATENVENPEGTDQTPGENFRGEA